MPLLSVRTVDIAADVPTTKAPYRALRQQEHLADFGHQAGAHNRVVPKAWRDLTVRHRIMSLSCHRLLLGCSGII